MKITVKEVLAILQIIVSLISIINYFFMGEEIRFPQDLNYFKLQLINATISLHQFMFALSVWFFVSRHRWQRFFLRIFIVVASWPMFILQLFFHMDYVERYDPEKHKKIDDWIEREVYGHEFFEKLNISCHMNALGLFTFLISNICQTIMLIVKSVLLCKAHARGEL